MANVLTARYSQPVVKQPGALCAMCRISRRLGFWDGLPGEYGAKVGKGWPVYAVCRSNPSIIGPHCGGIEAELWPIDHNKVIVAALQHGTILAYQNEPRTCSPSLSLGCLSLSQAHVGTNALRLQIGTGHRQWNGPQLGLEARWRGWRSGPPPPYQPDLQSAPAASLGPIRTDRERPNYGPAASGHRQGQRPAGTSPSALGERCAYSPVRCLVEAWRCSAEALRLQSKTPGLSPGVCIIYKQPGYSPGSLTKSLGQSSREGRSLLDTEDGSIGFNEPLKLT